MAETTTQLAFPSSCTLVFLVGVCSEWEKGRNEVGDVALFRTFHETCGIPLDHMRFMKDHEASGDAVKCELRAFLTSHTEEGISNLVFYYGGHGLKKKFCTPKNSLLHKDVVDIVQECFQGSWVWFLIDTCYSGNFYLSVSNVLPVCYYNQNLKDINRVITKTKKSDEKLQKTYVCIMSTRKNTKAEEEWILTDTLIAGLSGSYSFYYDADKKFSSKVPPLRVCTLLSKMADETARVKGDILTVSVHSVDTKALHRVQQLLLRQEDGQGRDEIDPKRSRTPCNDNQQKPPSKKATCKCSISSRQDERSSMCGMWRRRGRALLAELAEKARKKDHSFCNETYSLKEWRGINVENVQIGMEVYVKGRMPQELEDDEENVNLLPLWYPGRILSIPKRFNTSVCSSDIKLTSGDEYKVDVQFEDYITGFRQQTTLSCRRLLSVDNLTQYDDNSSSSSSSQSSETTSVSFHRACLHFAKEGKYISYSIPAGKEIKAVFWEKNKYKTYKAHVLPWYDVNWHEVTAKSCQREYRGVIGPYVPIEWDIDETWSIIPLHHVVFPFQFDNLSPPCTNRQSIDSSSTIALFHKASLLFAKEGTYISYSIPAGSKIKALFWEDNVYHEYKAHVLPWFDVPWHEVTTKLCRNEYKGVVGPFVPVEWEVDGTWTIIPLQHVVFPHRLDPLYP